MPEVLCLQEEPHPRSEHIEPATESSPVDLRAGWIHDTHLRQSLRCPVCGLCFLRFWVHRFKQGSALVKADACAGSPKAPRGDGTFLFVPSGASRTPGSTSPFYSILLRAVFYRFGHEDWWCCMVLCCALLFSFVLSATRPNRWVSSVSLMDSA